jgi:RNA polymerase sigma-70 factor, ECF subfamily
LQAADANFEQIVRDNQAMVFRTLVRLTGSREHVEDLAQEVFLRLYRALAGFRGDSLLTTYLYRIIVNVAQDEWKRRRRDRPLLSFSDEEEDWEERLSHPSPDAEQRLAEKQFRYSIEQELQQLSSIERNILVLYHQEELSYEQIALSLHLPIGTVRTHLHRGRKKIREALQRKEQPERGGAWQKTK